MDFTRLTNLQVTGGLAVGGPPQGVYMGTDEDGYGALFTSVLTADTVSGKIIQSAIENTAQISISKDTTLENTNVIYLGVTATAASKTLTLGLESGQFMIVANEGTTAFSIKNVSGDTAVQVADSSLAIVIASATADKTKIFLFADIRS